MQRNAREVAKQSKNRKKATKLPSITLHRGENSIPSMQ